MYQIIKYLSHGALICGTSILEAKGHHFVAIYAHGSVEGRVFLVFFIHFDLVVTRIPVHEGKHFIRRGVINDDLSHW
jgi:hypothetical protein